jgi:hypothetical protein
VGAPPGRPALAPVGGHHRGARGRHQPDRSPPAPRRALWLALLPDRRRRRLEHLTAHPAGSPPTGSPPRRLPAEDRHQVEAGFPPAVHDVEADGPFGNGALSVRERIFVEDYAAALRRAHDRLTGRTLDPDDDTLFARRWPPPPDVPLSVWIRRYRALFLTTVDRAPDRARAAELAATIVDYAGRSAGQLVRLRPHDGARSEHDDRWLHPVVRPYLGHQAVTAPVRRPRPR